MAGVELRRRVCALPLPLLFLLCSSHFSQPCPARCSCESTVVNCAGQDLSSIPQSLPENTSSLILSGNSIQTLGAGSFPRPLERLTQLDVSGCGVEQLDSVLFTLLPALRVLDLSNNRISVFNAEAPPQSHRMELLNLSRSLLNHSYVQVFTDLLTRLPRVSRLDLSSNDLLILPEGIFSELSDLSVLDLRNNTLVWFGNDTLMNRALRELDLRDNALKVLPNLTLTSDLRLRLAGNPWRCDCAMEDMLVWLERREVVVEDRENLSCSEPAGLRGVPLFQLERSRLPCWSGAAGPERVLEPSYVFLGMVLALIGVIFLLVLYLNRKGIKKWIYNIRDACRDHMEGYHYRYETSSSLNSHV